LGFKRIGVTTGPRLSGSRDLIGHLTVGFPIGHFLLVVLWNQSFISNSNGFWDIQWRMWRNGWRYLKRPLSTVQGHSFWYQSIPHMRHPIGCQY